MDKLQIIQNLILLEQAAAVSTTSHLYSGKPDSIEHDNAVVDWFCENGELRAYFNKTAGHILIVKSKNGQTISIGHVHATTVSNILNEDSNYPIAKITRLQNAIIKRVWNKLGSLEYCTNNLYHTPAEVYASFNNNAEYTFSNSSENEKSIAKHKQQLIDILNNLTIVENK